MTVKGGGFSSGAFLRDAFKREPLLRDAFFCDVFLRDTLKLDALWRIDSLDAFFPSNLTCRMSMSDSANFRKTPCYEIFLLRYIYDKIG